MPTLHDPTPKPNVLLALICLAVVRRLRPEWIAVSLTEAAHAEGVSSERVSRLCSKASAVFAQAVEDLTRIGRPRGERVQRNETRKLLLTQSLLEITTAIITKADPSKTHARALIVGSWLRVKMKHPQLTQIEFCKTVGISARCLRNWLSRLPKGKQATPAAKPRKDRKNNRNPKRRRFDFDITLPDTQIAADTTDIKAFGVPLKLMAAQDVGGRDEDLFDAVLVEDKENAEMVSQTLSEALNGLEGAQVITDQGTPYLAAKTREQLDQLEVEHAPQREAEPTAKATIERAFATVKKIAGPLLRLTDRIADAVPSLRDVELAKNATTVLLTALLRAYQAGARAARRADTQRAGIDIEDLIEAAKQSREKARAEGRSERMLLTRIHQVFQIKQPLKNFIKSYRHYPLEVIQAAHRAIAQQAHRNDIERPDGYFYRVVENCHAAYRKRKATLDADRKTTKRIKKDIQEYRAAQEARDRDPAQALRQAVDLIATQWRTNTRQLLFNGVGPGRASMQQAIDRLVELHGALVAGDVATGILAGFRIARKDTIGEDGVEAVSAVLHTYLGTLTKIPNR